MNHYNNKKSLAPVIPTQLCTLQMNIFLRSMFELVIITFSTPNEHILINFSTLPCFHTYSQFRLKETARHKWAWKFNVSGDGPLF